MRALAGAAGHHLTAPRQREWKSGTGRQLKDGDKDEVGGGKREGKAGAKRWKKGERREAHGGGGRGGTPIRALLSAAFTLNSSESGWLRFTGSTPPHTVEDISFQSSFSSSHFCTQAHTHVNTQTHTQTHIRINGKMRASKLKNAEVLMHIKRLYMRLLSRLRVDYLPDPTER